MTRLSATPLRSCCTATGRCPVGGIHDVLLRIVRRATCLSPPYESDIPKLASAIWSVLVSKDIYEALEIGGTTTGVSGESTRFEFVRQYATSFAWGTPGVEYCSVHKTESVPKCFEETLVGLVALYRMDVDSDGEWFSFFEALPEVIRFCRSINSPFDAVCESFLFVLSTVEKVARDR